MVVVKVKASSKYFLVDHGVIDFNLDTIGVTYDQMRRGDTEHAIQKYSPSECHLVFDDTKTKWVATIENEEVILIDKRECTGQIGGIDASLDETMKTLENDAVQKGLSIADYFKQVRQLEKIVEKTYDDVFPKGWHIETTEDIYRCREYHWDKINDLKKKLFESHVCLFQGDNVTPFKKLLFTNFSNTGYYVIINKKDEHIADAWLADQNVKIYCKSNDSFSPCLDFANSYDENFFYTLSMDS